MALVPFGKMSALVAFPGDLILFAYLLGLMRFFIVIAALDTGSSFEGMGASREVQFSALIEPALGVLLDVFVAVFVMGIMIFHISREFDHLDTDRLSTHRD